jgi:methionyl-tRNA formyltransferase
MKIVLLAGETKRTLCYLNALAFLKGISVHVLLYGYTGKKWGEHTISQETFDYLLANNVFYSTWEHSSIEDFVKKNNWTLDYILNRDLNSREILKYLSGYEAELVIFSGYGGQILRHPDFFSDKFRILHMHPGNIPAERGSTTMYYSLLKRRPFTVTSFYMTEAIDHGQILFKASYPLPRQRVDIDNWIDPLLRADCLIKTLTVLNNPILNKLENRCLKEASEEEYFVIHPVLKHISLLSLKD